MGCLAAAAAAATVLAMRLLLDIGIKD